MIAQKSEQIARQEAELIRAFDIENVLKQMTEGDKKARERYVARSNQFWEKLYAGPIQSIPLQNKAIDFFADKHGIWLLEGGCGFGKTIIAGKLFLKRGKKKALYIAPSRTSLENNIIRNFERVVRDGELPEVNEVDRSYPICFLTPFYFVKMDEQARNKLLREIDLIVVDETHRIPEDVEGDTKIIGKCCDILQMWVESGDHRLVFGMTGTANRTDAKKILGKLKPDYVITQQEIVNINRCPEIYGYQVMTKIDAKKISLNGKYYRYTFKNDKNRIKYLEETADMVYQVYQKSKMPFAVFVDRQRNAKDFVLQFAKISGLGNAVGVLVSDTSSTERKSVIDGIKSGKLLGYVTCSVGEESLDIPQIGVIHLIRRTTSVTKNVQACGRALRIHENKIRAIIVDYHTQVEGISNKWRGVTLDDIANGYHSNIPKNRRDSRNGLILARKDYKPPEIDVEMTLGQQRALLTRGKNDDVNAILDRYEEWLRKNGYTKKNVSNEIVG